MSYTPAAEMAHETAVRGMVAERYLLGELSPVEQDQYEAHYFNCASCAEELKTTEAFLEAGRRVAQEPAPRPVQAALPRHKSWRQWFWPMPQGAFAALALTLLLAGVQTARTWQLGHSLAEVTGPQAVPAFFLTISRAERQTIKVPAEARQVHITLSRSSLESPAALQCELSRDGRVLANWQMAGPGPSAEVEVQVPASLLSPGSYTLVLRAHGAPTSRELARYEFAVQHP